MKLPFRITKLTTILRAHEIELVSSFARADGRILPYTFFTDRSFLTGAFLNIIQPEMLLWHFNMASMNDLFRPGQRRGIIRRILPILTREYSTEEIAKIKFSIHFQLVLGLEVILVLTDKSEYLHEQLGSDNLVVVRKMKLIDSDRAYDEYAPIRLAIVQKRPIVDDIYGELRLLTDLETSIHLRYGRYTLTSARINLHRQYGDLLFYLQNGKCAITGDPLIAGQWHIDHIYPVSHGGNNSLINLRGTTKASNISKRDEVSEDRYCFSLEQFQKYGINAEFYRLLADRKLENLPLGFEALLGRDPRIIE